MKLITRFELATLRENELHAMLIEALNELAKSDLENHQRRIALASIENIHNEIGSRELVAMPLSLHDNAEVIKELLPIHQHHRKLSVQ